MREVKFRGRESNTSKWVYGDLIHGVGSKAGKVFILPVTHIYPKGCNDLDGWNVNPETIGQFTGLKDKNGNEIYEGDIIQLSGGGIMPVVFIENAASFCLSIDKKRDMIWFETDLKDGHYGVIGNCFDNPELLTNKKE